MAGALTDTPAAGRLVQSVYGALDLLGTEDRLLAWSKTLRAGVAAAELLPRWLSADSRAVLSEHLRAAEVATAAGGVDPLEAHRLPGAYRARPIFPGGGGRARPAAACARRVHPPAGGVAARGREPHAPPACRTRRGRARVGDRDHRPGAPAAARTGRHSAKKRSWTRSTALLAMGCRLRLRARARTPNAVTC